MSRFRSARQHSLERGLEHVQAALDELAGVLTPTELAPLRMTAEVLTRKAVLEAKT